jgi:hypothetical protein
MRSPKLFRHHVVDWSRAVGTRQIRLQVPYQEIYHRCLPIHQPVRYLCEWGKAVTGVTGMRDYAHTGNGLAQLGYELNTRRAIAGLRATNQRRI